MWGRTEHRSELFLIVPSSRGAKENTVGPILVLPPSHLQVQWSSLFKSAFSCKEQWFLGYAICRVTRWLLKKLSSAHLPLALWLFIPHDTVSATRKDEALIYHSAPTTGKLMAWININSPIDAILVSSFPIAEPEKTMLWIATPERFELLSLECTKHRC